MPYPYLLIEVLQLLIDELTTVINDDRVGEAEATYNVVPDEGVNLRAVMLANASASTHFVK